MGEWSGAGQGAVGGGMTGASIGSLAGPVGTVVGGGLGAVLGGIGGWFGGKEEDAQKKRMSGFYDSLGNSPQSGPAYTSSYSDFRNNQKNLISRLEAMADGRGPSLATEQLKAATDRNIAQQQGLAQSGQGNATFAMQNAANNSGRLGAQAGQDSAQARIQEQMNAINSLGINIHGARGADEGNNQFNAHEQNINQWGNRDAQMENNRLRLQALGGMGPQGPNMGEQLLAGGSGAMSFLAANNAARRAEAQRQSQSGGAVPAGANFGNSNVGNQGAGWNSQQTTWRDPKYTGL